MIEAKAPGKLYIAGEYAVIESGHPAILIAVDQYITVRLKPAIQQGSIRSTLSEGLSLPWTRKNGQIHMDERENPFTYVIQALDITEKYVTELGKTLHFFDLDITSDLYNVDGRKYGLGSSGAVTVATIKAILLFYQVEYNAELLYKLAALTHLSINSNGSFGDLAASSYGGWLAYTCFDREWVQQQLKTLSIKELVNQPWPQLKITSLTPPANLKLMIGWTGSPASTSHLVDLLNEEMPELQQYYPIFLQESKHCVEQIISGFTQGSLTKIQQGIRQNRKLLQNLGKNSGLHIETKKLFELCEIAEDFNGVAKSSGAGGGDCGIAIIDQANEPAGIIQAWHDAGITYLNFSIHTEQKKNQPTVC